MRIQLFKIFFLGYGVVGGGEEMGLEEVFFLLTKNPIFLRYGVGYSK